jgi:hypothetical protein
MFELWIWSALMNIALAMVAVALGLVLSHGAGLASWAAFYRLLQRIAFMLLAITLLNCALHALSTRAAPPAFAFFAQLAFMFVITTSVLRHLLAPALPPADAQREHDHRHFPAVPFF